MIKLQELEIKNIVVYVKTRHGLIENIYIYYLESPLMLYSNIKFCLP